MPAQGVPVSLFSGYDDKFKDMEELKPKDADITISFQEYHELKKAQHLLQCLDDFGVDNWGHYAMAIDKHMEVYDEY